MRFEFSTAARIIFGPGTVREAGPLAAALGLRALVVTGRTVDRAQPLLAALSLAGVTHATFSFAGEPTTKVVADGLLQARAERCDLVIGIGGGSAMDAAKAIAALLTNPGELLDYLEVIGQGKTLNQPAAPCLTIPTTAGTGAEVTRNAVLASTDHRIKVSLRSPLMLPRLAVVDPELTYDLAPALTASTGLDALTQLIEPYVSIYANPMTDSLCLEGMRRVARSLRKVFQSGADHAGREDMMLAGLFGGLALANSALGAVHGFAGPIGGMFPAPHGAVCAALLPLVMETNVHVLRQRQPEAESLRRYDEVARILTGKNEALADDGIAWVRDLCCALQIPPLRSYDITASDLPIIVQKARLSSSMKGNPIALTADEVQEILERAL